MDDEELIPGVTIGDALEAYGRIAAQRHPGDPEADWARLRQRVHRTSTMPSGWALWIQLQWKRIHRQQ
ncbi:hypothetical protein [Nocardia sp. alder85J]|uniref:hypothetical protein n=1 Tax=Nocardia sp. alder85J TaxID=2862949 RepID=UPI001CD2BADD|nr:hypothetical protein [Nocardia sp. alder85J]MCX4097774.1 hypothetical protein [Nocardia sp. alder85J]